MQIRLTGRHIDIGDALQEYAQDKLAGLQKHFDRIVDVHVNLSIDGHLHKADVIVHASGVTLKAQGEGKDLYEGIDKAEEKLGRQLEKYKGRLQQHSRRRAASKEAFADVAPLKTKEQVLDEESLNETPDDFFNEFMPKVVHQEIKDLQAMSVDEAVMQMDLLQTPFFIFQNPKSEHINVVYRRENGTIGWIEPQ